MSDLQFFLFIDYNVKIVFLHDQERQTSTQTQLNVFLACGFNQSNCQEKTHPNLSRIVQKTIKTWLNIDPSLAQDRFKDGQTIKKKH